MKRHSFNTNITQQVFLTRTKCLYQILWVGYLQGSWTLSQTSTQNIYSEAYFDFRKLKFRELIQSLILKSAAHATFFHKMGKPSYHVKQCLRIIFASTSPLWRHLEFFSQLPPPALREAHSPHVYLCGVLRGAQEHVGRPIPKCYHLVRVCFSGHRLCPCQACGADTGKIRRAQANTFGRFSWNSYQGFYFKLLNTRKKILLLLHSMLVKYNPFQIQKLP